MENLGTSCNLFMGPHPGGLSGRLVGWAPQELGVLRVLQVLQEEILPRIHYEKQETTISIHFHIFSWVRGGCAGSRLGMSKT